MTTGRSSHPTVVTKHSPRNLFEDRDAKSKLSENFGVQGIMIPMLIVVNARAGHGHRRRHRDSAPEPLTGP